MGGNYHPEYAAKQILWYQEDEHYISGRVIYDPTDTEEYQDFRWSISNNDMPSSKVFKLITILNNGNLLDSDKIKLNARELLEVFNSKTNESLSYEDFTDVLNSLCSINVQMVDDGIDTDKFYIHM